MWLSIPSAACALMCNCTCNPTFRPKCSHHVTDDNVRASPPLNRAYEHSPSAPTHGAFGSGPWFGPLAPFMALRGRQCVGTCHAECC